MPKHPIALLSIGLSLCQCGDSHTGRDVSAATPEVETPARSDTCGNAEVDPDEECDPAADDWQDSCDAQCHRSGYVACQAASDCEGLNANCAAYTTEPGQSFCAPFCEQDADCPKLPGFESRCNFAWCAVACRDGSCPHGMICVGGHTLLDRQGEQVGDVDVCVIDPA